MTTCMYCGLKTPNENHVCNECEIAGLKLAIELIEKEKERLLEIAQRAVDDVIDRIITHDDDPQNLVSYLVNNLYLTKEDLIKYFGYTEEDLEGLDLTCYG